MKVISYLATLPAKSVHEITPKTQTLRYFVEGVQALGDQGIIDYQMEYKPCDVAVILGWVHEHGKHAPHLNFRRQILEQQKARGARTIVVDSNLFLYTNTANPDNWLRYSFDGIFPSTGEYCDNNPDPARWLAIQNSLGVSLRPYRTNGDHILVCLQRDGGWSMGSMGVVEWAVNIISTIRSHSTRPIRIRPHPGDKSGARHCDKIQRQCAKLGLVDVAISNPQSTLANDLKHCWAAVNHNSSPAVGAAIEGIPIFVTDPERSQCREIANTNLQNIESPVLHDREAWAQRISQFHWNNNDIRNGQCWQHMRKWAQK